MTNGMDVHQMSQVEMQVNHYAISPNWKCNNPSVLRQHFSINLQVHEEQAIQAESVGYITHTQKYGIK